LWEVGHDGLWLEKVLLKAVMLCAFAHALLGLLGLVPLMLSFFLFQRILSGLGLGRGPPVGINWLDFNLGGMINIMRAK
jgi:hypothetical protein